VPLNHTGVGAIYRRSPTGRDVISSAGEVSRIQHYEPRKSVGIGCITSRRSAGTVIERLAIELGITVKDARRLLAENKLT
jgi:hypothetical protein